MITVQDKRAPLSSRPRDRHCNEQYAVNSGLEKRNLLHRNKMLPTLVQRIVLLLTSYRGFTTFGGSAALSDDKSRLKYRVFEELPRGTFVANLSADISDVIAGLSLDARALIRFRFLADFQPLFDIDSVSGVIRTAEVVDRDVTSLCRQKDSCEVNVDVVLQPVQYFQVSYRVAHLMCT
jgi:hypothetical protein